MCITYKSPFQKSLMVLVLLSLCLPLFAGNTLRINEFMASNKTGITTSSGETEDWIEIRNLTGEDVNLAGWSLTDSATHLTRFQFPLNVSIPVRANGFFLVFASGSETPVLNGQWHANFSLSKSGEYLALVRPDGSVEDELYPAYPEQYTDISYGVIGNDSATEAPQYGYFLSPTPRLRNKTDAMTHGRVAPVTFDQERGFRTQPFQVVLRSEDAQATLRYTLDGSTPTENSSTYTGALTVSKTTVLRAIAFKEGALPSAVKSRTWIFLDDVLTQSTMRRSIVNNNKARLRSGLQDIPTLSLSTDSTNLYGSTGIFDNYGQSGEAWERPVSVELIDPQGGDEFEIYAGLRIRGAVGRSSPKKSLRLLFGSDYEDDLHFPLFGDEGAQVFTKVDLRTEQNNAWSSNVDAPWQNTFVREVFSRDTQRDMGELYTRSRYYHLYINGTYWGIYMSQERAEADFASSYQGGDPDDWDALKSSSSRIIEVKDGTEEAYSQFYQYALQGFTGENQANYWRVKGLNPDGTLNPQYPILLDEENLINYILLTLYTADADSPLSWINVVNNVSTVYHRTLPAGFQWLKHDAELSLGAFLGIEDSIGYFQNSSYWSGWNNFNPMDLHRKLIQHPEYFQKFMDGVQEHYLSGGTFAYENALKRWNERAQSLEQPILAESARWGNQWGGRYTAETWKSACHQVTDAFMVGREYETLALLQKYGWYSTLVNPPTLKISDSSIVLTADAPVYFTLDGSDPRLPGGSLNPQAQELTLTMGAAGAQEEEVLIPAQSSWRCYDTGETPPEQQNQYSLSWTARLYNDYSWEVKAPSSGMRSSQSYLRKSFVLPSLVDILSAKLTLLKGNGTILLNGTRVSPGAISPSLLRLGRNLLTVSVNGSTGFDLSVSVVHDQSRWGTASLTLSDSTWFKARTFKEGNWSALCQYDTRDLDNPDCSLLRVSEMMYAANLSQDESASGYTRDDFAWLELFNASDHWMNLKGVQFTGGIQYTFPDCPLAAGGYLVLAKNPSALATRYDTHQMQMVGPYSSNLSRKGETLTLSTPQGTPLLSFTYSNSWYPQTDQGGYSLVVVDPLASEPLWSTAENWEPSLAPGGTPGTNKNGTVHPPPVYPPSIISQPLSQNVIEGESVTLSVTASGTAPLTYQWFKAGVALEGATGSTLLFPNVSLSDSGSYTVAVSHGADSVTSQAALLSVKERGIYANATLFHRYSFNTESLNGKLIVRDSLSHADGTLYGNATLQNGYLSLDGKGDTRSFTNGSFVALPPDLISTFPSFTVEIWARANRDASWMRLFDFGSCSIRSDGTIGEGANYTMTTWKSGDRIINGVRLNGTEHQVSGPALPIGDGLFHHIVYTYRAETQTGTLYTDGTLAGKGTQEFNPTQFGGCPYMWIGKSLFGADPYFEGDFDELRIYKGVLNAEEIATHYTLGADTLPALPTAPEIIENPMSQTLLLGSRTTLSVSATGSSPLSYQWYKDGGAISGATGSTYSLGPVTRSDEGTYYVIVSNTVGHTTSHSVFLSVQYPDQYAQATLAHRYSFSPVYQDDKPLAIDSIQGAHGTLYGSANLQEIPSELTSQGFLSLDGSGDTRSFTNGSFVALPPDLISNFTSFSVEMWARATANKGAWMRLFDFGNCSTNADGTLLSGRNYTMMTWKSGDNDMRDGVRLDNVEQVVKAPALPIGDGLFHHLVYTYNAETQTGTLYTDGALSGQASQKFNPTQFGGCPNMWIGKSQWSADPYFAGDFDEFRIYEGVLTAEEVSLNYQLGTEEILVPKEEEPTLSLSFSQDIPQLHFTGKLQVSTDLKTWEDLPQAQSPWTLPLQSGMPHFYRTRN